MTQPTVARSYADALFELGRRTGEHEAYALAFESVAGLVESDALVRNFLASPKIQLAAKKDVLVRGLKGRVPQLFLNFLLIVLEKRRQRLFPDIARAHRLLLDQHLGRLHVQVTVAREPDERSERDIADQLTRILGKQVIPHIRVDGGILGGIVVRYGDRVLDGSLRRRLISLRRRLLEAALPATSTT